MDFLKDIEKLIASEEKLTGVEKPTVSVNREAIAREKDKSRPRLRKKVERRR